MEPGTFLVDAGRAEERFRVQKLLHAGDSYQIALAEDVFMDDKLVCVKAIAYDAERTDDKKYVALRRKALFGEMEFLANPIHLIPEPLDWIQLDRSETVLEREPVLIYEFIHGDTLLDLIRTRFPEGIAPLRALRIFREIVRFLSEIHQRKYVFRDLDPRHVVVGYDDIIHVVGCGNATPMGEAPNSTKLSLNEAYTAPEIRAERSGQLLRPAADIYSAGALLSFMLTGEEPRASMENPLTRDAYERLTNLEYPGIALLVARCLQPMAKSRFGRAERLARFCTPDALPTSTTKGFGMLKLPAPWTGAEPPESRGTRSSLSSGPLISVGREKGEGGPAGAVGAANQTAPDRTSDERSRTMPLAVFVAVITLMIAAIVALIVL